MDISAHASSLSDRSQTGQMGHQASHAPGRPLLHLVSSSRRPRQENGTRSFALTYDLSTVTPLFLRPSPRSQKSDARIELPPGVYVIATSIHRLSVAHSGIAQRISRLHVNPNATACFEQSAGSNNLDVDCGRVSREQAFTPVVCVDRLNGCGTTRI